MGIVRLAKCLKLLNALDEYKDRKSDINNKIQGERVYMDFVSIVYKTQIIVSNELNYLLFSFILIDMNLLNTEELMSDNLLTLISKYNKIIPDAAKLINILTELKINNTPNTTNITNNSNDVLFQMKQIIDSDFISSFTLLANDSSTISNYVYQSVIDFIVDMLINKINNVEYVLIAFDGIPSFGKIQEQRQRRYMRYAFIEFQKIINATSYDNDNNKSDLMTARKTFDKIQFHVDIKSAIEYVYNKYHSGDLQTDISDKINNNVIVEVIDMPYGEGEKILVDKLINDHQIYKNDKSYIFYSPDGDSVVLCLHIYIKTKIDRLTVIKTYNITPSDHHNESSQYVNINTLYTNIINLVQKYTHNIYDQINDMDNICTDFIIMMNFFGNDFIHQIPTMEISTTFMDMMYVYCKFIMENDYITKHHQHQLHQSNQSNQSNSSSIVDDFVYQISCAVIEHNGYKYVISARKKIILCKKIELYYCKFGTIIYKNELRILFQSIETNIVILGTVGYDKLRLDLSVEVMGNSTNQLHSHPYSVFSPTDIPSIIISEKFTMPKLKKKYYASMIDVDIDRNRYIQNIYQFTYVKSFVTTGHYLPPIYMFEFELTKKKQFENDFRNLYGTFMFGYDGKPVGLVTEVVITRTVVLPIRHVYKIINSFFNIDNYAGSLCLPISYSVKVNKTNRTNKTKSTKKFDMIVNSNSNSDGSIKSGDKIISIDNKEIIIEDGVVLIFDDIYMDHIPFDVYLRLNLNLHSMMNIVVERKNKIISYDFVGVPIEDHMLILTDQPYFLPIDPIPFVNLGGLIIVQFTHELIDILACNKIKLNNYVVNEFMAAPIDNRKINHLLIIKNPKKKIVNGSGCTYAIVNCLLLLKINGVKVHTLTSLKNLIKKQNILTVSLSSRFDTYEINI